jgi:hypothetical protein
LAFPNLWENIWNQARRHRSLGVNLPGKPDSFLCNRHIGFQLCVCLA